VALARLQMNKLEEATALLRERRKVSPGDYLTAWFLGDALSRQGVEPGTPEEKEAFSAVEDAVKADPRASAPRTLMGKLLLKRGQTEAAAEAFETALQLDAEDMTAAYQLALLSRRKGDTKRAEELFAKVSKSKAEDREQAASTLVKIVREGSR
jgi:tetratricopeptide (TPR) repeat protein